MNIADLNDLAARATREASRIAPDTVSEVRFTEAADGSCRSLALLSCISADGEQEYTMRLATPAPDSAPGWARVRYPVALREEL